MSFRYGLPHDCGIEQARSHARTLALTAPRQRFGWRRRHAPYPTRRRTRTYPGPSLDLVYHAAPPRGEFGLDPTPGTDGAPPPCLRASHPSLFVFWVVGSSARLISQIHACRRKVPALTRGYCPNPAPLAFQVPPPWRHKPNDESDGKKGTFARGSVIGCVFEPAILLHRGVGLPSLCLP